MSILQPVSQRLCKKLKELMQFNDPRFQMGWVWNCIFIKCALLFTWSDFQKFSALKCKAKQVQRDFSSQSIKPRVETKAKLMSEIIAKKSKFLAVIINFPPRVQIESIKSSLRRAEVESVGDRKTWLRLRREWNVKETHETSFVAQRQGKSKEKIMREL